MRLNHSQRIANKLRNAERHGPSDRVCNKYTVNPHRTMRHLARVGPGPHRMYVQYRANPPAHRPPPQRMHIQYTHTHCTLHYTLGCMHCELDVTGPIPSDGGELGGGCGGGGGNGMGGGGGGRCNVHAMYAPAACVETQHHQLVDTQKKKHAVASNPRWQSSPENPTEGKRRATANDLYL